MLINGLQTGLVRPYNEEDLKAFRSVYYGGIPASIILLSDCLCNGFCYDRALLLAEAFLAHDDVEMVYADVDTLRFNPKYASKPAFWDHCILEKTTADGTESIYDPAYGLVFDKDYYWKLEHPKVRLINNKAKILEYLRECDEVHHQDRESDKYVAQLIFPLLERTFELPNETYAHVQMLQREIALFKEKIGDATMKSETRHGMNKEPQSEKRFFMQCMNSVNNKPS